MLDLDSDKILLEIHAAGQATPVGLYYRIPTTSELQKYKSSVIKIKDGKVKYQLDDVKVKMAFGALVCNGIREGDFGRRGVPISSDPESKHYDAQWKQILRNKFPQLVVTLASMVFDGVRPVGEEAPGIFSIEDTPSEEEETTGEDKTAETEQPDTQEAGETLVPLSGNSAG